MTLWDQFFTYVIPFNALCRKLGKRFKYFAPGVVELRLKDRLKSATADERGNFIPVRHTAIVERIAARCQAAGHASVANCNEFANMAEALYRFDSLALLDELRESFAPFDPDSDYVYERKYSAEEREVAYRRFVNGLEDALTRCNYEELPRETIAEILNFRLPDELPVVAKFDDFAEFRVFVRGVSPNPVKTILPSSAWGKSQSVASDSLRRVCIFARLKPSSSEFADAIAKLRAKFNNSTGDGEIDDVVIVKMFKNIALEDLKMVTPRVSIIWRAGDIVKIGGTFAVGSGSAIVKFIVAAAFNLVACLVFFVGFVLLSVRNALKLFNKRTAYLQRHATQLYGKSLASNFAAANMLVTSADEQEVKEFFIGYFMALERGDWATEEEIDSDAEAFLKDEFGVDVDFESSDSLRKLREKGLLEEREDTIDGETVKRYRVLALDKALEKLDFLWDNIFLYNNNSSDRV